MVSYGEKEKQIESSRCTTTSVSLTHHFGIYEGVTGLGLPDHWSVIIVGSGTRKGGVGRVFACQPEATRRVGEQHAYVLLGGINAAKQKVCYGVLNFAVFEIGPEEYSSLHFDIEILTTCRDRAAPPSLAIRSFLNMSILSCRLQNMLAYAIPV